MNDNDTPTPEDRDERMVPYADALKVVNDAYQKGWADAMAKVAEALKT